MNDPVPVPIAGPIITPNILAEDAITPGSAVQAQGSPQQNINLAGGTYNPNTTTVLYTVPAGKTLVITSGLCTGGNASAQPISFLSGSTVVATGYIFNPPGVLDLCQNGVVTIPAGTQLRFSVGAATAVVALKASGYLVSSTTSPAPATTQLPTTPGLG